MESNFIFKVVIRKVSRVSFNWRIILYERKLHVSEENVQ
jgi:hypothetical protein